jgi:hypothetical protein
MIGYALKTCFDVVSAESLQQIIVIPLICVAPCVFVIITFITN